MGEQGDPQMVEDMQAQNQEARLQALEIKVDSLNKCFTEFLSQIRDLYGKDQLTQKYGEQLGPLKDIFDSFYPGTDPLDLILKQFGGDYQHPGVDPAIQQLISKLTENVNKIKGVTPEVKVEGATIGGQAPAETPVETPEIKEPIEKKGKKDNIAEMMKTFRSGVNLE